MKKQGCKKDEIYIRKFGCAKKDKILCAWCRRYIPEVSSKKFLNSHVSQNLKSINIGGRCALCHLDFIEIIYSLPKDKLKTISNIYLNKRGKTLFKVKKEIEWKYDDLPPNYPIFFLNTNGLNWNEPKGCKINGVLETTLNGKITPVIRCGKAKPKIKGYRKKEIIKG